MNLDELKQKLQIGEDEEFEAKKSGENFPDSFWHAYSAFANTQGGCIVLGVEEVKDHQFSLVGLGNPGGILSHFFDLQNNPNKISASLLEKKHIQKIPIDGSGRTVLVIHIPRADRKHRPVFTKGNPFEGTFKRNHRGDYKCSQEEVRRMLREASDDPMDADVLEKFYFDDFDPATLAGYRQSFKSLRPDHPFVMKDDKEFLESLGAWRRDRTTGSEGPTKAGLLMFGREKSIREAFPYYFLDYQERLSPDPDVRWTHRITFDGTWEGNLFNFYHRVYQLLSRDLQVPFQMRADAVRSQETHVHEALREALVNTLIHCDYHNSKPVLVLKRRRDFSFSNPGLLRVPLDQLYKGGVSDCRNPNLQKMFEMVGLGEHSGSGFDRILRAWREQSWMTPQVREFPELELTAIALPTISMVPEEVRKDLEARFGDRFVRAEEIERTALVLAHQFGQVTNADLQHHSGMHPTDIGKVFSKLMADKLLERDSRGRATSYHLSGERSDVSLNLFDMVVGPETTLPLSNASGSPKSSQNVSVPSYPLPEAPMQSFDEEQKWPKQREKEGPGRSVHLGPNVATPPGGSVHLGVPTADQESGVANYLQRLAENVANQGRVQKKVMEATIQKICATGFVPLDKLAEVLNRSAATLRIHYLSRMVKKGKLELKYPDKPNHPQQAYRSVQSQSKK